MTTVELVASGRLSTVHRVPQSGGPVAVKRARGGSAEAAESIRREARVLRSVADAGIVAVLDVVEDGRAPALVLPWAEDGDLGALMARGGLAPARAIDILTRVATSLEALHAAGELHLDVTPANILLSPRGPWLCDPAPPCAGTPGWVDPAVVATGPASARSDVFGLAVTATVCLTGVIPRPDRSVAAVISTEARRALAAALSSEPRRRPASPCSLMDAVAATEREIAPLSGRRSPVEPQPLPRTWPFPQLVALGHERIRDGTGSTHGTAKVSGWRRTRRGG